MTPGFRLPFFTTSLYAGLVGYALVAVVMAGASVVGGHSPFWTAALFGTALFGELGDPATLAVTPGPVFAYNGVHLLTFLVLGTLATWLVRLSERHPSARYVALVTLLMVFFHAFAAIVLFAQPLLAGTAWISIGMASAAAGVGMVGFLIAVHPEFRRQLRTIPMGGDEEAQAERPVL